MHTQSNALQLWQALAYETVRRLAAMEDAFSTDDVWKTLDGLPIPDDPRALGPVLTRAAKEGVIAKSDLVIATSRKNAHARPIAVWLSRIRNAAPLAAFNYVAARKKSIGMPSFAGSLLENDATQEVV